MDVKKMVQGIGSLIAGADDLSSMSDPADVRQDMQNIVLAFVSAAETVADEMGDQLQEGGLVATEAPLSTGTGQLAEASRLALAP